MNRVIKVKTIAQYGLIILTTFLISVSLVDAQTTALYDSMKLKYPEDDAVFLSKGQHVTISISGGNLDIDNDEWSKLMFLTENGARGYSGNSLYYSSFTSISKVDAITLIPNGKRYKKKKVEHFEESNVMSGGVFYDDRKRISFTFPGTVPGAIADLRYTEEIYEPRFLGAFYFQSYVPVEHAEYSISFPSQVNINYIILGEHTDNVEFEEYQSGGLTTYKFTARELDVLNIEDDAPNFRQYEPHVIVYIDNYKVRGEEVPILSGVSDLYNWYYSLTDSVNLVPDYSLEQIVEGLIDGKETEKEKIKSIFQWVQQNVKYVAFEDGLGGFIPREAALVCEKRYGDCKDMASIITEMLEIAGLDGQLTWIGTRDIPYSYHQVPTPMVDNHMIAAVKLDGKWIFLDATDELVPFGFPTSMIQGKEALIGLGEKQFELVKVPIIPKEENGIRETVKIELNKDLKIIGTGRSSFHGYLKGTVARRILSTPADRKASMFKTMLEKGHNKFTITKFAHEGELDLNGDLHVDYDFEIEDYVRNLENEVYVNLNLDRTWESSKIDVNNKKLDKEFRYKYVDSFEFEFTIPENYSLDFIPKGYSYNSDDFGIDIRYHVEGNKVLYQKKLYLDCLVMEKEQFEEWNNMISGLKKAYKDVLVLKQNP